MQQLFAEIDGQGWGLIIAAIFVGLAGVLGSIGAIITGVLTLYLQWKREEAKIIRDAATAQKVEGVATALQTNTARTEEKLDVIHDLCNSAMLEQKRMHAVKCRAAADQNPTPVNLAEALAAEAHYNAHASKQAEMERAKHKEPAAPKYIQSPTGPITSAELKQDIADVPEKVANELDQRKQSPEGKP